MQVSSLEGHRHWAATYDAGPNPLLSLETRLLLERLNPLPAGRFLDIACGTGRWMQLLHKSGSQVFGVDFCREMLLEAARKPGLAGCLSLADACRAPFHDGAADLTLCSLALGYLPSPHQAIAEMARISRPGGRVVISDLHPAALAAGWTRSFRSGGEVFEIDHHRHPIAAWEDAADSAGLAIEWRIDAGFGEPERVIFRQAAKESLFSELSRIPALLAMCWRKL